ncbi:LLM class flavin-dependent oxidoreductase [Salsuginibacillus kocurii]|uniref:LLM class flavin-dependent oxidoreductase n=1 Tax=Salsuginibacillus kocurii TaxID=427078 RepID=UPI00037BEC04|nr:LLM class flavin-dependent oxidoreductase [Salsuginibacillus kocurii]
MSDKQLTDINYSLLDLSPILEGSSATESFQHTVDLAQHAENLGYTRYWMAEHHNMPFIGSSATSVLIGHVASHTNHIRVGSGGIMLPNHAPLVIAEQFGTLESLHPGRIDLGLGRAPGTDQRTMQALRRNNMSGGDDFPQQLNELRAYFEPADSPHAAPIRAIPGQGLDVPIWLLGSSGFSAQLAGQLGLPFAFASHFSPNNTIPALDLYHRSFVPSEVLDEPYAMVGLNVVAAETDEEANWLGSTLKKQFLNLIRNTEEPLQPPIENIDELMTEREKIALDQQLSSSIFGSKETVREQLQVFLDETQVDEMMITAQIYDHNARLKSFELVSDLFNP